MKIVRFQDEFGREQRCRGKSFATFCPLGSSRVTADEIAYPNALTS